MIYLNDLIKIEENVLSDNICDYLIDCFENNQSNHEVISNDRRPNFTQLNVTQLSKQFDELEKYHKQLIKIVIERKKSYYSYINSNCFPESNAFEYFRIKRYLPNSNEVFDAHVDVTDHESARRFLSFMVYLNDVDDGGETVFDDLVIKPKKGKLVIFPPLWMFPHKGKEPLSGPKYILTTYLHYK